MAKKGYKMTEEHKRKIGEANKISKIKHGLYGTQFYRIYYRILERCNDSRHPRFKYYGGKGVKVSWQNFIQFRDDMYESYRKHVEKFGEKNTSIDRIDGSGGYNKENCRWATYKVQNNNRSYVPRL